MCPEIMTFSRLSGQVSGGGAVITSPAPNLFAAHCPAPAGAGRGRGRGGRGGGRGPAQASAAQSFEQPTQRRLFPTFSTVDRVPATLEFYTFFCAKFERLIERIEAIT